MLHCERGSSIRFVLSLHHGLFLVRVPPTCGFEKLPCELSRAIGITLCVMTLSLGRVSERFNRKLAPPKSVKLKRFDQMRISAIEILGSFM